MIGMTIDQAKGAFFDTEAVTKQMDRQTRKGLSRFGAFVRRRARSSIRKRKRGSAPGEPPTSRTGHLRRHIYFAYDEREASVVVGAAQFAGGSDAPEVLEVGGRVPARKNPRRRKKAIGDGGVLRMGPEASAGSTAALIRPARDQAQPGITEPVEVVYGPLESADQVARAERFETEIWGPLVFDAHDQAARPYMQPAFDAELPAAAGHFRE